MFNKITSFILLLFALFSFGKILGQHSENSLNSTADNSSFPEFYLLDDANFAPHGIYENSNASNKMAATQYGPTEVMVGDTLKYKYFYDSFGRGTYYQTAHLVNSAWINLSRVTYEYGNNNLLLSVLNENWVNNSWNNSSRNTYGYDINGNRISGLNERWVNSSWVNYSYYNDGFDSLGNRISSLYLVWSGGQWVNSFKYSYFFDSNKLLLSYIYERWVNNEWVNNSRSTYTSDNNGNRFILQETWKNNSWAYSSRSSYYYDKSKQIYQYIYEIWTNNAWVYNSRTTYYYNDYGCCNEEWQDTWGTYGWTNYMVRLYDFDNKKNAISGVSYRIVNYNWSPYQYNLSLSYNNNKNRLTIYGSNVSVKYAIVYPNVSQNTDLILNTKISGDYVYYLKNELSFCNTAISGQTNDSLKMVSLAKRIFINLSLIHCDVDSIINEKKPILDTVDAANERIEDFYDDNIAGIRTISSKYFFDDLLKLFSDPKYLQLKNEVESISESYKWGIKNLDFNSAGLLDSVTTKLKNIVDDFNKLKNNQVQFNLIVKLINNNSEETLVFNESHYKSTGEMLNRFEKVCKSFKYAAEKYNSLELKDCPTSQALDSLRAAITYLSEGLDTLKFILDNDPFYLATDYKSWIIDTKEYLDDALEVINGKVYYFGNDDIKIRPVVILQYPYNSWSKTILDFYRITNRYRYTFNDLFPDALPKSFVDRLKEDMILNLTDNEGTMNSRLMEYKNLYLNTIKQGYSDSDVNFGIALIQTYSFVKDLNGEIKDFIKYIGKGNFTEKFDFRVINDLALTDSISHYFNNACGDPDFIYTVLMITKQQPQPYSIDTSSEFIPIFIPGSALVELRDFVDELLESVDDIADTFTDMGDNIDDYFNMNLDPNYLDFSNVKSSLDLILALEKSNKNFLEITPFGILEMSKTRDRLREKFAKYSDDMNNMQSFFDSLSVLRTEYKIDENGINDFISETNSFVQEVNTDFQNPDAATKIDGTTVNLSAWFDNPPQHLLEKFKWYFDNDPATDNTLGGLFPDRFFASGLLVYANTAATPLGNSKVYFNNQSGIVDSSITDDNGYFVFPNKPSGWYFLTALCNKSAGGVNSTDALLIRRYQAGAVSFDPLQIKAADVNGSNTINSTDALLIRRKVAGIDSEFKIGSWTFENPSFDLNGTNINKNIRSLCVGDVNGSFTPLPLRKIESIQLFGAGKTDYDNSGVAELSVSVSKSMSIGALSLFFNYSPDQVEIIDITNRPEGLMYSAHNGKLNIAWDDVNSLNVTENALLFSIKVRLLAKGSSAPVKITLDPNCEIADYTGKVIENVILKMPVESAGTVNNFRLEQNYPNPFNPATTIQYTIPEKCFVTLKVFDGIGRQIALLVNEQQDIGKYIVNFDARNLSTGVYYYKIQAGSYTQSHKMLLIK